MLEAFHTHLSLDSLVRISEAVDVSRSRYHAELWNRHYANDRGFE